LPVSRAFAFISAVVPTLIIPGAAFSDTSAASACAGVLPAEAKAIYNAAAPEFAAAADPCAGEGQGRGPPQTGAVQRGSARSSAMTAGDCLKKLR